MVEEKDDPKLLDVMKQDLEVGEIYIKSTK